MIVLKETSVDLWLVVVVSLLAIAANLPDEFAIRYSIEKDYFLVGLIAVLIFSLVRYVRFGLVLMTIALVIGANLPRELAEKWNVNPEVMFFTLWLMVVVAGVNRFFNLMPNEQDVKQKYATVHGTKALFSAISKGKVGIVGRLIQSGVDVNVTTVSGKTPLMIASFLGYTDIVHMLTSAGADIFVRDRDGNSALNIAQRKGYTRIVSLLENAIAV